MEPRFLERALELAERGRGNTHPNPIVGAAVVLEGDLVDKVLVFVAPRISGEGPGMLEGMPRPLELSRMTARPIGDDVLLQAYLNEP